MPPSMRRQTRIHKSRVLRDDALLRARQRAFDLLQAASLSIMNIQHETGVSKSLLYVMRDVIKNKDSHKIEQFLRPDLHKAGRKRVLSDEEEAMISQRMITAARRGFPVDVDNLCFLIRRVVADGREVPDGYPSADIIRSYRARHRELTYRKTENKENAKLAAESYNHVMTYVDVFRALEKDFPGLLKDSDKVWNMDETAIKIEFGERSKSFTSSSSHYGGFKRVGRGGNGKHVTAVVAASASGLVAPPFLIVAGKNVMSNWFLPLQKEGVDLTGTYVSRFNNEKWFPSDGFVVCTENGSMEKEIMPLFIEHLDRFVRKTVPPSQHYVLCLDGHSSRKGVEWLHECLKHNCQALQSPANTTHKLQPCDQLINKTFNTVCRKIRDVLINLGSAEQTSVKVKLMCATEATHSLTPRIIKDSFKETGIWPMNFDLAERFRTASDKQKEHANDLVKGKEQTAAVLRNLKRQDDETTALEISRIMRKNIGPSRKLQAVQMILKQNETVNDVLMSIGPGVSSRRSCNGACIGKSAETNECKKHQERNISEEGQEGKKEVLLAGTPAVYLTHAETIAEREKKVDETVAAETEKVRIAEEKKRKSELAAAERETKRIEKANRKAERERKKLKTKTVRKRAVGAQNVRENGHNKENLHNSSVKSAPRKTTVASCPLQTLAEAAMLEERT